jgi:hypothetical protein
MTYWVNALTFYTKYLRFSRPFKFCKSKIGQVKYLHNHSATKHAQAHSRLRDTGFGGKKP